MPQREAYIQAGYSTNYSLAIIDTNACNLAKSNKVLLRLQELRSKVEKDKVMPVQERMERLSEIARARLTDYQEAGLDGAGYISITKDSPNTAAIQGIESATKFDEEGNTGTLFTKIKLHNPMQALDLLNKMDGAYAPEKHALLVRVELGDFTDDELLAIAGKGDNTSRSGNGATEKT